MSKVFQSQTDDGDVLVQEELMIPDVLNVRIDQWAKGRF